MQKKFPGFFHILLLAGLALLLAIPGQLTAETPPDAPLPEEPNGWQMLLVDSSGTAVELPLDLDYTADDVEYTLSDPYLPLRPLAEAAGVNLSWRRAGDYGAIVWGSAERARVFVADRPEALHIYKEENGSWVAVAEQQFEQPRLINGSFCVPLSFLDCLGIRYDLDAENARVTVYANAASPADTDELWQAAEPLLTELLTPKAKLLAEAVTYFNSAQINRSQNILLAAGALHGLLVLPGEEFSFNRAVGQRTAARGYLPAPMFNEGETVSGLGGGVCQVSTTVYQAALQAGLAITERHPHTLPVTYAKPGADATVVWGHKDLRWQNNTDKPLQIACSIEAGCLIVRLYQLSDTAAAAQFLGQLAK